MFRSAGRGASEPETRAGNSNQERIGTVNISVEPLAPCRKLVRVEVEAAKVDEAFAETLKEYRAEAILPGFRRGKAPLELVERKFQKEIEEAVRRRLLQECLKEIETNKGLRPLRTENLEVVQFGRGQALNAVLTLETEPEFDLPEYKGLPAKREIRSVTEEDVERALEVLRRQRVRYQTVDRPAATGDIAVINYTATVEGRPLREVAPDAPSLAEARAFWVNVERNAFLPGFGEQLTGARAGESRTIHLMFPPDFPSPALAGRPAAFQVEVVEIKEVVLPPLDDQFARDLGAENLEALRAGVRRDLENELKYKLRQQVRSQLIRGLLERVHFDLPESLVENETRRVVYQIVRENTARGVSRDLIEREKETIYQNALATARDRVKWDFLVNRIAEKENIKVTEEDFHRWVAYHAALANKTPQQVLSEIVQNQTAQAVHDEILHGKVLEFLEQHAHIEDVPPDQMPVGLAIRS
nr:trigger factor [Limisphaera ngatamarikiensis]